MLPFRIIKAIILDKNTTIPLSEVSDFGLFYVLTRF